MRKILIIGATSAIAQATAKVWAGEQHALFLIGRDEEKLRAIGADLKQRGASLVDHHVMDINDFSVHPAVIARATEALDGLDTVLVAHGTLDNQETCQQNYAATEQALKTNFLSVVSLLTPLANQFEKQRHGCLAVISSVAGDRGRQSNYIYGTAKGALSIFLQGLRNRLHKSHVCVLTIKPGFVDSPMTADFKKGALWAKPEDIAKGIVQAVEKGKNEVYLPWFWRWIMLIIGNIPEFIFKRLKL